MSSHKNRVFPTYFCTGEIKEESDDDPEKIPSSDSNSSGSQRLQKQITLKNMLDSIAKSASRTNGEIAHQISSKFSMSMNRDKNDAEFEDI